MRNVGTYIKSWFGRFDAVGYRRPDPWLWLPAAVLLLLGLLMVLNTTYFLGIEKKGDTFQLWVSWQGEKMHPEGAPIALHIDGPFYVGIGFASHLPATVSTAKVSDVVLENRAGRIR